VTSRNAAGDHASGSVVPVPSRSAATMVASVDGDLDVRASGHETRVTNPGGDRGDQERLRPRETGSRWQVRRRKKEKKERHEEPQHGSLMRHDVRHQPSAVASGWRSGMKRRMSGVRKGVWLAAGAVGLFLVLSGCTAGPYQSFYHPGFYPDEYNVPDGGH